MERGLPCGSESCQDLRFGNGPWGALEAFETFQSVNVYLASVLFQEKKV